MEIVVSIRCIVMALELPPLNINAKEKTLGLHLKIFQYIIFWSTIPLSHCQGAWFCLRPHLYPSAALLLQDHPVNVKEP